MLLIGLCYQTVIQGQNHKGQDKEDRGPRTRTRARTRTRERTRRARTRTVRFRVRVGLVLLIKYSDNAGQDKIRQGKTR